MTTLDITLAEGTPIRHCSGCTACCKLLPMRPREGAARVANEMVAAGMASLDDFAQMSPEFFKRAGARCPHQRHHKGCAIYARRPYSCRIWNCRWLVGEAGDTARPDRAHYVIDIMPDVVRMTSPDFAEPVDVPVIQIWVDPKFPDAHRDPALRAWLLTRYEVAGEIALIRYDEQDAFALLPPPMTAGRGWVEERSAVRQMARDDITQSPDQWRMPTE